MTAASAAPVMTADGWLTAARIELITNRWPPRTAQLGVPFTDPPRLLVWHTTEGATIAGALEAYRARAGRWVGGVHPHLTVAPSTRELVQHVPLTHRAFALRWGDAFTLQVEVVGAAAESPDWPASWFDWLGRAVAAPILRAVPTIPLAAPFPFLGPDAGLLAAPWPRGRARVDAATFRAAAGFVGHQHATRDTHWDPGAWRVDELLAATLAGLLELAPAACETGPMQLITDPEAGRQWLIFAGPGGRTVAREYTRPRPDAGAVIPGAAYVIEEQAQLGNLDLQ